MSCRAPLSFETLVAYWAGDLAPPELDEVDEHLIGCAACTSHSARVAAVVQALRGVIPPVVTRSTIQKLQAAGTRIRENAFLPGQRQEVVFASDLDVLIHRLTGFDLTDTARVHITVRSESSREILNELPVAPFDPAEGVLIACQQHFRHLPTDIVFEVRAIAPSGAERLATYTIPHTFE
jgi:hypothetical protein